MNADGGEDDHDRQYQGGFNSAEFCKRHPQFALADQGPQSAGKTSGGKKQDQLSRHAGQTLSRVTALADTARIEEIARMLGGVNITDTTRSHAAEMLGLKG